MSKKPFKNPAQIPSSEMSRAYNLAAEQELVSCIMSNPELLAEASQSITSESFLDPVCSLVFDCMCDLDKEDRLITLTTIYEQSIKKNPENSARRVEIAHIYSVPHYTSNFTAMVAIVMEYWIRRSLYAVSATNMNRSLDPSYDVFDTMSKSTSEMERVINKLTHSAKKDSFKDLGAKVIMELDEPVSDNEMLKTGIMTLDGAVLIMPTDLVVVAGRPGMGKTSFVVTIAKNAVRANKKGMLFTLEMGSSQMVQKILSALSSVPYDKIRHKQLSTEERKILMNEYSIYRDCDLDIIDNPCASVESMKAKASAKKKSSGLDYIMIDYLQLINATVGENREQQIAHMTRECKKMAKTLEVPVILLSQLSRESEKRADRRPYLSDLRESGAIEQDADTVLLLYRPEYYGILKDESGNSLLGKAEVIVAKHRHGVTGAVSVDCNLAVSSFY